MVIENENNKKNAEDYCKFKYESIKKELRKYSVEEKELDAELRIELTKLKNTDFIQKTKIDEIAIRITDNIKLKKIERELNNLLESYKEDLPLKKKKRLLNKLISFKKKEIFPYQQCYQKKKEEVNNLIKRLESDESSYQSFLQNNNFSLAAKSMIGFYLLTAVIVIFSKLPKLR
ncbi:MAG: hypothetical protein mread185_000485 [Mycoplasmataceae bacterium]|nr:MAG: hypothetical protein mread185_000485 [Mycoplasmataceae bacterium]